MLRHSSEYQNRFGRFDRDRAQSEGGHSHRNPDTTLTVPTQPYRNREGQTGKKRFPPLPRLDPTR